MSHEFSEGNIVLHPKKPEWGPGKVCRAGGNFVDVIWRDTAEHVAKTIRLDYVSLELAAEQSDPVLDNLPPLVEEGGKYQLAIKTKRITFQGAIDEFLAKFANGFYDEAFIGDKKSGERAYKLIAHEYCVEQLGEGKLREKLNADWESLCGDVLRCVSKVNFLSPYESAAFKDALKDEGAAKSYLNALAELLEAAEVSEATFTPYVKAVCDLPAERGKVATWPVATVLPFLIQPERYPYLKPGVTQQAADAMAFHLNYQSKPNWLTYSRLIEMMNIYQEKLETLKPRDWIDVQSFLYVACGGDGYKS